MSYEPDRRTTCPLIGDLHLPPGPHHRELLEERVPAVVELHVMFPDGRRQSAFSGAHPDIRRPEVAWLVAAGGTAPAGR